MLLFELYCPYDAEICYRLLKSMKLPNKNVPLREIRKVEPRKRAQFRREYALKEGFELSRYMRLR